MPKNQELLDALNHPSLLTRPDGGGAVRALDELIKVDRTNANAFRQAILNKKAFWHGLGAFTIVDATDTATAAGFLEIAGDTPVAAPNKNFETLHKIAVQRRVEAGLKAVGSDPRNNALLEQIINGNAQQVRNLLATQAGKPFGDLAALNPPAWNAANDDFLTGPAVTAIQAQARQHLLINKISACRTEADITAVIATAVALPAVDGNFQNDIEAHLGIDATTKTKFVIADFTDTIKKAALEKGLALAIDEIRPDVIGTGGTLTTLNKTPANFKTDFGNPPYHGEPLLDDIAVNKAKGQLGQRFLTAKLAQLEGPRVDHLIALASQGDVAGFVTAVKTHADLAGGAPADVNNFVAHAVTPDSLPSLRQTAALQALKIKIAQCEDPAALDALIAATTKEQVKQVLTDKPALGFSTSPAFREAFNNLRSVDEIVLAAQVQKRLLTANPDQLKAFAKVDGTGTYTDIKTDMKTGLPTSMHAKMDAYLNLTPERITEIRQQALLGYAKTQLTNPAVIDNTELNNLVRAGGHVAVAAGVTFLMNGGHEADDLVTGKPHDSGFSQQLRAYAAVEQVVRNAGPDTLRNLNGGDYDTLRGLINDFTTHTGDQRPLIAILPPKEKQALQERLVTELVSRFPAANATYSKAKLSALATAKDEADFRRALTDMGITGQDWVNDASRARVQKAACPRALELQINASGPHPQLFALAKQLPLKKQQELLTRPDVMAALLNVAVETGNEADAAAKVRHILGLKSSVNVNGFIQENKNLALLSQIANPEVARILAQQTPPLTATPAVIQEINAMIHANVGGGGRSVFDDAGAGGANYIKIIKDIKEKFYVQSDAKFFAAFGLDAAGTALSGAGGAGALRGSIEQQHARNQEMIAKANERPAQGDSNLITFCMALQKTALFTSPPTTPMNSHYAQLKADIQAAPSIEEFMRVAATRGASYYGALDPASLRQQLTPEVFKQLKREQTRQVLMDTAHYGDPTNLPAQKAAFDEMANLFAEMRAHDNKIRSQLESFGNTKSIDWFNPAFHYAAKQNADKLGEDFRNFAKGCDSFLTQLEYQKEAMEEQLKSLPAPHIVAALDDTVPDQKTQKQAIEAFRKELTAKLEEVNKDYNYYKKIEKVLKGDLESEHPLLKQGLLKTVEQAQAGKHDIKFHFESTFEDVDVSKRKDYFKRGWEGSGVSARGGTTAESELHGGANYYHAVPALEEGKIRVHKIAFGPPGGTGHNRIIGGFIEERGTTKETVAADGSKEYAPSIRMTINEFPRGVTDPNTGALLTDPKILQEAQVNYSMAFACQMLAGLHEPPSAKNPIVLDGWDEEELRHLWTAFVVMGDKNPDMRFDASAIKVVSPVFNPKKEEGYIAGLASGSHYHKIYMKSDSVRTGISYMQEASGHRSGHKKEHGQLQQDLSKLSQMFKQGLQTITDVENANAPVKKTPTLGSGG